MFGKSTQHLENRFIIGMNGGIEAEVTFFQAVRPKLDIEAPVCLHARFNPNSLNSIVIMRDIAGEVEFCNYSTPMTLELARSTPQEKESQLARLQAFHAAHAHEAPAMLKRLQQAVIDNGNVFEVLMDAVRVCSLGQITNALFEVGGQYRRNM